MVYSRVLTILAVPLAATLYQRVDSVIEFIRLDNYALIYWGRKFCEMIVNDYKAIHENLVGRSL